MSPVRPEALRPAILVAAILVLATSPHRARADSEGRRLHVVTYNIRSGLGPGLIRRQVPMRVQANLREIARDLASASGDPRHPVDVVALNEVDVAARRSAWLDQASFLADELARRTGHTYRVVHGETWRHRLWPIEGAFGNAVLVRHPIVESKIEVFDGETCSNARPPPLPRWIPRLPAEKRGAVRVTVRSPIGDVDVITSHLDPYVRPRRLAQAACLADAFVRPGRSTIVLGDMNSRAFRGVDGKHRADDLTFALLSRSGLESARDLYAQRSATHPSQYWATFPANAPHRAIDWILASDDLTPTAVRTIGGEASDHLGFSVLYERMSRPPD